MEVLTLRAPNPGPLTLGGTKTYVVDGTVIDPGPVERIVLTHRHPDHAAGAGRLSELSGASILAFGERLQEGDRITGLVAVHTPGHAPDHLCFWHPENRTLFSGNLIAGEGSILVTPPGGDLEAYEASLKRVRVLAPVRILPEHGLEVSDAVTKIDEYLAHRREREERVAAALESGASSLEEVVDLAYSEVPMAMRPYARLSARAHLEKLGHRTLPT